MIIELEVEAETYDNGHWRCESARYVWRGKNRKAAITWALNKIEKRFPGHRHYKAEIVNTIGGEL